MAVTNNYQQKMQNAYDNATAADQSSYDSQTINNSSSRSAKQNLSIDDYEAQANNMLSTLQSNKSQQNQTQQSNGSLITGTNYDNNAASQIKNMATQAYTSGATSASKDGTSNIGQYMTSDALKSIWQPEGADSQYLDGYYKQLEREYGGYTPQQMYLALSKADATTVGQILNELQTGYTDYVAEQQAAAAKAEADAQKAADAEIAKAANTKSYADYIQQMYDALTQQENANIDKQVSDNVQNAQREYEDQYTDFRDQYRTYTNQMYQGMDNAALNARANGQFGGTATQAVGAQQSYYQQQRQQLATKQRKLADDTVNQINKLRQQGEYDKADALLKNTQSKLTALYEDAVRIDENQYSNWQYDTTIQREDEAIQREKDAADLAYRRQMGMTLLGYGIVPDDDILKDMGMNRATATAYAYSVAGAVR